MVAMVFRRRLRAGVRYERYREAWMAEKGYGVPARVLNATSVRDEREVLTVGFVRMPVHALMATMALGRHHDRHRHDRIDGVIEGEAERVAYEPTHETRVGGGEAIAVSPGSAGSILRFRHVHGVDDASDAAFTLLASRRRVADASAELAPPRGGLAATVIDLRAIDEPGALLTLGFVPGSPEDVAPAAAEITTRLDAVTETVDWDGVFRVRDEHDFQKAPLAVPLGSPQSIL